MTNDDTVIKGLKNQSSDAVDELVDLYGTRLVKSAFLLCGNEADAQDIVQETFITAIKAIRKFRGASSLYTWLHGIMINEYRHFKRKQKSHVTLEHLPEQSDECRQTNQLENRSTRELLLECMNSLSSEHREVLVLRYFEEMTIQEIAKTTGMRKGTVKSRLHYAIVKLKDILPEELQPERMQRSEEQVKKVLVTIFMILVSSL
jgi:RNA polymerase sigma-70 factor (ECF subfamily)